MGELLNLVGFSCGVVLYAMLLAMVVRASRAPGGTPGFDPLLLATALLGLVWNLCALPAYELPKVGIEGPFPVLIAVGFPIYWIWGYMVSAGQEWWFGAVYVLIAFEHYYLDGLIWSFRRPHVRETMLPFLLRRPAVPS